MPVRLFTDADRERLNRFPRDISPTDLLAFFTLSDDQLELIGDRRGDQNRLGFGLQLKTLVYLGFVPDDLTGAPARVVSYLALQLSVSSDALQQYGDREHTRTDHLREIQDRLGFRDTDQPDLAALGGWLLDRALEHDGRSSSSTWPASGCCRNAWCDPESRASNGWWRRSANMPTALVLN